MYSIYVSVFLFKYNQKSQNKTRPDGGIRGITGVQIMLISQLCWCVFIISPLVPNALIRLFKAFMMYLLAACSCLLCVLTLSQTLGACYVFYFLFASNLSWLSFLFSSNTYILYVCVFVLRWLLMWAAPLQILHAKTTREPCWVASSLFMQKLPTGFRMQSRSWSRWGLLYSCLVCCYCYCVVLSRNDAQSQYGLTSS